MAFIISTNTVVSPFTNAISINASLNARVQNLFQISVLNPIYDSFTTFQTSISITTYAPGGQLYEIPVSVNCEEANSIPITVDPGDCAGTVVETIDDDFFATSYAYNKERNTYGTESWTLVTSPLVKLKNGTIVPHLHLRGVSTGFSAGDGTGVEFSEVSDEESTFINITAGFPGVGKVNTMKFGTVSKVGGGTGPGSSDGQANVTIPYVTIPSSPEP